MDETIAAISTPIGEGGIAIVRVSGASALAVADAIFRCRQGKPSDFPSHTVHLGTVAQNGSPLDQVLLVVMRRPHTYTGEDTVEINCHGGPLVARRILKLCLESGARLAQPGEFTKRAFLNGKMDLTQAEAVMDLITAKTELAQAAAMRALEGHLTHQVRMIRERLLSVLARIEAGLDFPEEDIPSYSEESLNQELLAILEEIDKLLTTAGEGKILRHGISVAIVGRPNAGKSSLLNRFLGYNRAIVTPIPGTTRDTLEETVSIRGIPVRMIDTAGLRRAGGKTEALSVQRTRKTLESSDLAIHVLDASRPFSKTDDEIAAHPLPKARILVLNKVDLPRRIKLPPAFVQQNPIEVSALLGTGLEALAEKISAMIWSGVPHHADHDVTINERHNSALKTARNKLTQCLQLLDGVGHEILAQQIRDSLNAVGEITGDTATEDLLNAIFSRFCIGK